MAILENQEIEASRLVAYISYQTEQKINFTYISQLRTLKKFNIYGKIYLKIFKNTRTVARAVSQVDGLVQETPKGTSQTSV